MRVWLLCTALTLAVVAAGIITFISSTPAVSSKDVGFDVTDSTRAAVDFRVTKDADATAQCAVQVLSSNYAVVGWTVATISAASAESADGPRTTRHQVDVRITSQGVSGGVNSCWLLDGG